MRDDLYVSDVYYCTLCSQHSLEQQGSIGRIHHLMFRACDNRATKEWLAFLLQAVRLNDVSCPSLLQSSLSCFDEYD